MGMVMCDNEFETMENKKIKLNHNMHITDIQMHACTGYI